MQTQAAESDQMPPPLNLFPFIHIHTHYTIELCVGGSWQVNVKNVMAIQFHQGAMNRQ